ncbi:hypothetical protein JTB14_014800 [Gonioctena quinquepunctata]|nr:hypothetical protein JTB14_014800 [Gonioctena quinquepunctata]
MIAKCKKCFKYVRNWGTTSNLHTHMKTHPDTGYVSAKQNISKRKQKEKDCEPAEVGGSSSRASASVPVTISKIQSEMSRTSNSEDTLIEGGIKYNTITLCILYFICKDMRLFHIVEDEGFLKLTKTEAPFYTMPSSLTHFKMPLGNKYDIVKMEYVKIISNEYLDRKNAREEFLGRTAHFVEGISIISCTIQIDNGIPEGSTKKGTK